jgi:uncharacterized protein with FMN-binding domain
VAMRRAAIVTTSSVAGVVLLLSLKPHQSVLPGLVASPGAAAVASPGAAAVTSPAPSAGSSQSPQTKGTQSQSTQSSGSSGGGATGTYTGAVEQTPYGPVQVAVTLSHGTLTGVKVLQVPNSDSHSQRIAAYAVPQLTQEALAAHSAQINAVSGASYTSQGYVQSLQSALDKAGA